MRLQTLSGQTKKRERPSENEPTVGSDSQSTSRSTSSLSIKVEGGSGKVIPPKPKTRETAAKRYLEGKSRQQNASNRIGASNIVENTMFQALNDHPGHIDPSNDTFTARKESKGYSRNEERRKSRAKDKHSNPGSGDARGSRGKNEKVYKIKSSAHYWEEMKNEGIPIKSWFVIFILVGFSLYYLRKACISEQNAKRKLKERQTISKGQGDIAKHKTKHQSSRYPSDTEDAKFSSRKSSSVKNMTSKKKKEVKKRAKIIPPVTTNNITSDSDAKSAGIESPDSISTDGSASTSTIKNTSSDYGKSEAVVTADDESGPYQQEIISRLDEYKTWQNNSEWQIAGTKSNRKTKYSALGKTTEDVTPMVVSTPMDENGVDSLLEIKNAGRQNGEPEIDEMERDDLNANLDRCSDVGIVSSSSLTMHEVYLESSSSGIDKMQESELCPESSSSGIDKMHESELSVHQPSSDDVNQEVSSNKTHANSRIHVVADMNSGGDKETPLNYDEDSVFAKILQLQEEQMATFQEGKQDVSYSEPVWEQVLCKKKKRVTAL